MTTPASLQGSCRSVAAQQAGDAPAFLGAAIAGFGAKAAVLDDVFGGDVAHAFLGAALAHRGAILARGAGEAAAARQITGGQAAELRAVDIEGDAADEGLRVGFAEAGDAAVVATGSASIAGIDAGSVLLVGHDEDSLVFQRPAARALAICATCRPWKRAMASSFSLGWREPSPPERVLAP